MRFLIVLHVFIIAITNILVQFPFILFGYHATWGVFSYPLIFIITDLTVRLSGASIARKTVCVAMFPGLIISYLLANCFHQGADMASLLTWNTLAFRVAIASFTAYFFGQLTDIIVFQRLRQNNRWWVAPSASSLFGNVVDTAWFFFVAFYHSSNPFFAAHWIEIAVVDLGFKLFISFLSFLPMYWLLLQWLQSKNWNAGQDKAAEIRV